VHILTAALSDSDKPNRMRAAVRLGQLGKSAQIAISALVAASRDTDNDVKAAAREALKEIDPSYGG
jgi:HEAT repeat protein